MFLAALGGFFRPAPCTRHVLALLVLASASARSHVGSCSRSLPHDAVFLQLRAWIIYNRARFPAHITTTIVISGRR
ncbi:hypothetical protein AOLI_G00176390 [Acnodon oligacanthus]